METIFCSEIICVGILKSHSEVVFFFGVRFFQVPLHADKAVQLPLSDNHTGLQLHGGERVPLLERGWRSVAQLEFVEMSSIQ